MARIQAGSTLVNQYAPPFVVSDSVAAGWQLRWNQTLLAFEAYDPNENLVETGFDSIQSALFAGVSRNVFTVPWEAASKESLIITIDGVKQQQPAYQISVSEGSGTTVVQLAETPVSQDVEILGLQTSGGAIIELFGPVPADFDSPNIAQDTFILPWVAPSEQSLIISIDGVKQNIASYQAVPNLADVPTTTTLTFSEVPFMSVDTATQRHLYRAAQVIKLATSLQ